MPKIDQRTELLRLIARDPTQHENSHYLRSEGIAPQSIGAAVRRGEVLKVGDHLYTLTDAGRAVLSYVHPLGRPWLPKEPRLSDETSQ